MGKKTYTDIHGVKHSLTVNSDKPLTYENTARIKAVEYSRQYHTDVFYSLRLCDSISGEYKKGMFFLIPIERREVQKIINEYGGEYMIGIVYDSSITDSAINPEIRLPETGYEYEQDCAEWLSEHGFTNVETTKKSGDQGIDVIAYKDGLKYGIQCKLYSGKVSNKAVQEAHAGAAYYNCDVAVVMTTSDFTQSAIDLAHSIGVKLWKKGQ